MAFIALMHAYEQISPRIQQYMLIQAPKVIDENPSFKEEHYNMCAAIQRGNPEYAKLVATLHCSGLFLDAEQISSGLAYTIERMQEKDTARQ